jgi:hypothetical protein
MPIIKASMAVQQGTKAKASNRTRKERKVLQSATQANTKKMNRMVLTITQQRDNRTVFSKKTGHLKQVACLLYKRYQKLGAAT